MRTTSRGMERSSIGPKWPVLPVVIHACDLDRVVPDLVKQLVVSDDNASHFSRVESGPALAQPREISEAKTSGHKHLDDSRGDVLIDRDQVIKQSIEIRLASFRPENLHSEGGGSGWSVPRLSAHA